MKFSLLAVGQQFEYQGETYIKSTPLIAHQVDTGEQRLIPRSASVISSSTNPTASSAAEKTSVDSNELRAAFAELEGQLAGLLEQDARVGRAFEQARQRFFDRLGVTPVDSQADDHSAS